jgi:hypothetical protein
VHGEFTLKRRLASEKDLGNASAIRMNQAWYSQAVACQLVPPVADLLQHQRLDLRLDIGCGLSCAQRINRAREVRINDPALTQERAAPRRSD